MEHQLLVVLILYLAVESIDHILLQLNRHHLAEHGAEVPPVFADVVDAATLARMRDYTLCHGRVDRLHAFVSLALTTLFLFGGLLNRFNNLIAARQWPTVMAGVVFFLALVYADTLINIPFSLYNTFVVEKRFGFSNQTFGLWLQDLLKTLLLNTLLLGVLFYGLLWMTAAMPETWWLAGWLFVFLFTILLLYVSPYVIEPLFNKYTPIENPALEERIKTVLAGAGLQINRVFTMDASRRSSHSNAYFSGIGHVKRIVLFDTLLANHAADEIIAILAHEAGHWKKKHLLKMLLVSQAAALLGFYLAYRLTTGNFLAELFGLDYPTMHAKLLLVAFLGSLALYPIKPLLAGLSRRHEIEADDFAVELTQKPGPLADGLIKLARDNLANLHPHPWYAAVHYSHPPIVQRVGRILSARDNGAVRM